MATSPGSVTFFVDTGDQSDGSKWYALKTTDNPDLALCGLRLRPQRQGTDVTVIGLRRKNVDAIVQAVESGKFFCRCETLSK